MAITYGMSVIEFWEDDPYLFWAYRFSYFEKLKTEQEMFNHNAWLQGAYFNEAVSVALCNAFSKTKVEYSKKPYGFNEREKQGIEDRKRQSLMDVLDIKSRIVQINKIKGNSSTYQEGKVKKVGENK